MTPSRVDNLTHYSSLLSQWPGFEYLNFFRVIYWSPPGIGGVDCAGELAIAVADTYDGFSKVRRCRCLRWHR